MRKLIILLILLTLITPAFALTNSTISCIDNTTLEENITVYMDGNASTISLPIRCQNGCDNVTNSCEPLEYEQYGLNLILVIITIGGMVLIYKFARSRI